jgi:hypothetical protein
MRMRKFVDRKRRNRAVKNPHTGLENLRICYSRYPVTLIISSAPATSAWIFLKTGVLRILRLSTWPSPAWPLGGYALAVLAQLRLTGRILDFRISMNRSQILGAELDFGQLLPADPLKGYKLQFQYWPRDIAIRRYVTTSSWVDVPDLVAANNATVQGIREKCPESCAIGWAVVVGEDSLLKLPSYSPPPPGVEPLA